MKLFKFSPSETHYAAPLVMLEWEPLERIHKVFNACYPRSKTPLYGSGQAEKSRSGLTLETQEPRALSAIGVERDRLSFTWASK